MLVILKKELARFFGDKRMAVTTILLPGLMIFVMYSVMGDALSGQFSTEDTYVPTVVVNDLPEMVDKINGVTETFDFTVADKNDGMEMLREGGADLYVSFPKGFDLLIPEYPLSANIPEVRIYYNSSDTDSSTAYAMMTEFLNEIEDTVVDVFEINTSEDEEFDIASDRDLTGQIFSSMLPMILIMLLFSGCMAVAPESIAGEKERGTMASLLITPASRANIALGKIAALSVVALLSGASSFLGTALSLPKLMGGAELSGDVYTVSDYALVFLVILSTVLFLVAAISLISAAAKTVKEAQSYVIPLMIAAMGAGVSAMFGGAGSEIWRYFIPLYNSVQCMSAVFSFGASPMNIAVCVVSNLVYAGIGVAVLARMFSSEKIMYSK